jgi:hypothetical protein
MEVQTFINWFLFLLGFGLGYYFNTFSNTVDKLNEKKDGKTVKQN